LRRQGQDNRQSYHGHAKFFQHVAPGASYHRWGHFQRLIEQANALQALQGHPDHAFVARKL
jgi:hypothetical protein